MRIGILQTGFVPQALAAKHGQYPAMFERLLAGQGFTFETFVVAEGQFPAHIHACDGWLITGSSDGAYESHAYIPPLEDFIRAAYAAEVPVAGICFGHQIMAQALGGVVAKHAQGWSIGDLSYKVGDDDATLLAMHQDQVVTKPADAQRIASSDFCLNAGFAYPGKSGAKAISFQPHPEFTPEYVRDFIALNAGNSLSTQQADDAIATIREENDSPRIAQQLADFFHAAQ